MKRLIIFSVAMLASVSMAWAAVQMMSVQVRQGKVREKPYFLSKIVTTLPYAARVKIQPGDTEPWYRVVTGDGQSGYMHSSALLAKDIQTKGAGGANVDVQASSEELSLAGKGFNKDVETAYRAKNSSLDYTWVDKAETNSGWTPGDVTLFIQYGGLTPVEKIDYTTIKSASAAGQTAEGGDDDEPGR